MPAAHHYREPEATPAALAEGCILFLRILGIDGQSEARGGAMGQWGEGR